MHFLRLSSISSPVRRLATAATAAPSSSHHKIIVVGVGGAGGIAVAAQIRNAFKAKGQTLGAGDIAIIDPAQSHYYMITSVVATGLKVNFSAISGLETALQQSDSGVRSIYSYDTVDKVWGDIHRLQKGKAIFTQPTGAIKCPGAPQKIMWMAYSTWKTSGVLDAIQTTFVTGMPWMFAVEKYSKALDRLRQQRQVEGLFTHSLTSIDANARVAKFSRPDGTTVEREYDFSARCSLRRDRWMSYASHRIRYRIPLGWVEVNPATMQHVKFKNVFSLGDCSSTPNSKTVAAITSQAPVLVHNLLAEMDGKQLNCCLRRLYELGHNELMLCEFKYGNVPDETFAWIAGSQDVPRRAFYHLKKDLFPRAYFDCHMHGRWFGRKGLVKPAFI
ncbi:FAD/NAD(P)-binding domain-containing protein [Melanogaster broomeanus]|nr:FAD/NAD(P)-binding domain-containing protein [Melanogaster broomeanus]